MGWEHEAETVWQAQSMYCVDRLSFEAVARETGVAASTLKRWSEKYGWREKREEIAKAEADIRADKVKARAVTLKALIEKPGANMAFAHAALESQALKEEEAARKGAMLAESSQAAELTIQTPADALAALRTAVEQRLAYVLARPEIDVFAEAQKVTKTLALISQLEAAQPETENTEAGISASLAERIEAAMRGDL
ncbi:MAG: hypothetical protein DELT_02533 [Desulfovibrio sp.]